MSTFYKVLGVSWGVSMLGGMAIGEDWHFQALMGMICLAISCLYDIRKELGI